MLIRLLLQFRNKEKLDKGDLMIFVAELLGASMVFVGASPVHWAYAIPGLVLGVLTFEREEMIKIPEKTRGASQIWMKDRHQFNR